ncbi:sensor histidine kinase [Paenibacillus selenitireducens]|uniref:sensor histidine kinase n=1 Tax=Paenibacillus selenitireducens TaxID=1324314 RepID=UPI001E40A115|nr:HAMP domain-containing sensor histidine kinase [Paenibacillus selenitireducens]
MLIVLWITAILLLISDWRNQAARWLSAVAFCGGSGALASVLQEWIRPLVTTLGGTADTDVGLYWAMTVFSLLSYYGLPYCYLMFAGTYISRPNWRRFWGYIRWILPLPILLMLCFRPYYPPNYDLLVYWAVPYIVFGTVLIVSKRGELWERRSHGITMLAVVPAVVFAMVMNYVLPVLGIYEMWRYNVWTISLAFAVFVTALFKSGFLGVQLFIERRQMDMTLRAITSGTSILNHAIKNDLGKIQLFCDKLISNQHAEVHNELVEDVQVIQKAAAHIQDMVSRVHHRTQDLIIRPEVVMLERLILDNVNMLEPQLAQSKIAVITGWDADDEVMEILVDRAQIQETVNNIMINAIDAMPKGGTMTLQRKETKRAWILAIQDTGVGIPKDQLAKVTEPFFTTKQSSSNNFGLGLAYCYQVMKKHGGTMKIESKVGAGTTVYLYFSKNKRLIRR